MPYVPPHLRGQPPGEAPPKADGYGAGGGGGGGGGGYGGGYRDRERGRYDGAGDYGSFGSRDRGDRDRDGRANGSYGGSFSSSRREDGGGPGPGSAAPPAAGPRGPPEIVWPNWQPSERVRALTPAQVAEIRDRLNITVEVAEGSAPAAAPIESFDDMNLPESIIGDIKFHKYEKPTPIQCQGVPVALSGRDILGCAETGSGKTASFALPMIAHCLAQAPVRRGDGPLALVLAPTRELAQQIEKEIKAFSRTAKGFRTAIVVGGTHMGDQRGELRTGVEVVVATPGRFIDHLQQGNSDVARVGFLVLDEADRMLDMGFEPQIREVMHGLPKKHQTLLFSATMPEEIEGLANEYLRDPVRVKVGKTSHPTANVSQALEKVATDAAKTDALLSLVVDEYQTAQRNGHEPPLTIIFVERKAKCDEVADALLAENLPAAALHGGRSQGEREAALRDFRKGTISILVATDVASRGLDVTGVAHVINMDLPKTFEDYVHRIGRTGRAGMSGRATSFYLERDMYIVSQIKRAIAESESGNVMAFATGKAARQREREAAAAFRDNMQRGGPLATTATISTGGASVKIDDKLKNLLLIDSSKKGAADDAWDD